MTESAAKIFIGDKWVKLPVRDPRAGSLKPLRYLIRFILREIRENIHGSRPYELLKLRKADADGSFTSYLAKVMVALSCVSAPTVMV